MVKKILIISGVIFFCLILFLFLGGERIVFVTGNSFFNLNRDFTLLFLGKPGPGYIGSENTDSIMVMYYNSSKGKLFIIPIPRDLIVYDEYKNLHKINALYPEGKIDLLLRKVSSFTGLKVRHYLSLDLSLILKLIDKLGGIEVYLDEPITDAVTLYTIPRGYQKINGYLAELVLRSRYNPSGDFFRIKNQIKVIFALKEKIMTLDESQKLALVKFFEDNKYHWQTNLDKRDLLYIFFKIKDLQTLDIVPIVVDFNSGLLKSSSFEIYNTPGVYGIIPTEGIDNFKKVNLYINTKIKEALQ